MFMDKDSIFKMAIKENLVKNVIIVVLVFLFYPSIFSTVKMVNKEMIGNFLLVLSMLLVTVCFAAFAFSYEYTKIKQLGPRLLSHLATFIFMLLIALSLEILVINIGILYPSLEVLFLIYSVLLYLGIALYDFWDLFRAFDK